MSEYKFIYKHEDKRVIMKTYEVTATEIVRDFKDFLLGTSFYTDTIKEALLSVAEELEESCQHQSALE
jgi:hypothetical protein